MIMDRFYYTHFENVPQKIEREYNKILRREKYLEEREKEFRVQRVNFEEIQESVPDPKSLPENEIEMKNQKIHEKRLDFLPIALEMSHCDFQEGYVLIHDYYFNGEKNICSILDKKAWTDMKYRLKLAREMLKKFIITYENSNWFLSIYNRPFPKPGLT